MPAGRPRKWDKIDVEQLRKCAEKFWSVPEIAAFFKVSHDVIERHFASIIAEARESGRAKLRDLQWKRALEGSDRMIIHMSEHKLGEVPQAKNEVTGESSINIRILDYGTKPKP